ncbi:hypothetical protein Bca4012_103370 [Brassica carinata]
MVAREELSPSPDQSIDRVAPPPLRSDSKFGKGKGAVSSSNLLIDRSVGTRLVASVTVSRQGLLRDSDPRELPQEDVGGDCVVEGAGEIVPARANDDLAEIRRDRATAVDGIPTEASTIARSPGGKNSPTDGQGKRRSRDREKKRGIVLRRRLGGSSHRVDGSPTEAPTIARSPDGENLPTDSFCYRHDGAIG